MKGAPPKKEQGLKRWAAVPVAGQERELQELRAQGTPGGCQEATLTRGAVGLAGVRGEMDVGRH